MGLSVTDVPLAEAKEDSQAASRRLPRWFEDRHGWAAAGLYLIVVVWYEHKVIGHMGSVCSCANTDPTQWMWSWKWIPYAITHGQNPFFTHRIWAGTGFDLAAATLAPVSAIVGSPLSALFGSIATYNLFVLVAPILNGWVAYRLCRYVSRAPWASVLAGFTYAFSAYDVGHLLGHVHLMFAFVPPLLILTVLRYLDGEISRQRATVAVAVLLLIEFGLSTEVFFDMSYLGVLALISGYVFAPEYRGRLIQAIGVLAVGYVIVGVLSSYYIYEEFNGSSESKGFGAFNPSDLLSYVFPTDAFKLGANRFAPISKTFNTSNPFEQNVYLGLPLCAIVLAVIFGGWRRRTVKIVGITTIVAFVLSLGTTLTVAGQSTYLKLPYNLLEKLPFFDLTLPTRLGLFLALGAALAAALWLSWAGDRRSRIWRWAVGVAAVIFLLPNPGEANRINAYAQPAFFTTSSYKHYLQPNEVVMTIPFGWSGDEMLWQADTDMYFKLAGGYFGTPPPSDVANAFVDQLYLSGPTPSPAQGAPELKAFVSQTHIGAVLIQDGSEGTWPAVLAKAGFRLKADVGGMEIFDPVAGGA